VLRPVSEGSAIRAVRLRLHRQAVARCGSDGSQTPAGPRIEMRCNRAGFEHLPATGYRVVGVRDCREVAFARVR
jgi:hypothetical protein